MSNTKLSWSEIISIANKGNLNPPKRIEKSNEEWAQELPSEVYFITREKGTERAHSSDMCTAFEPGIYACACCNTHLFDSSGKFDSGTGWPSFSAPLKDNYIAYHKDTSYGMIRVETTCNICDAHLGHVFPDGPPPTGLRFCINALALKKISD